MRAAAAMRTVEDILASGGAPDITWSESVLLCETTPAMEMVGMRPLPVMLGIRHLHNMMTPSERDIHLHGLDEGTVLDLPRLLSEPAAIFDASPTSGRSDAVIMLLDDTDDEGNPIIAAIRPNATSLLDLSGRTVESNHLLSAYGRLDAVDYLKLLRSRHRVLFVDGERLESLARHCRRDVMSPLSGLRRCQMLQPSAAMRRCDPGGTPAAFPWMSGPIDRMVSELQRGISFYAPESGRYLLPSTGGRHGTHVVNVPLGKLSAAASALEAEGLRGIRADELVAGSADFAPVGRVVKRIAANDERRLRREAASLAHERWVPASGTAASVVRGAVFMVSREPVPEREEALSEFEGMILEGYAAGVTCDVRSRAKITTARDER